MKGHQLPGINTELKDGLICILLPAYNEAENIVPLLNRLHNVLEPLKQYNFEIVVIDDGSTDDTVFLAQSVPFSNKVKIISHSVNKGLAEGMRTALLYLANHPEDNVIGIAMDADNTHNPISIPQMLEILQDKDIDLVVASRFTEGGEIHGLAAKRKFLSNGAFLVMKMFFRIAHISDYTGCYRAYRKSLVQKAFRRFGKKLIEAYSFCVMAEILLKLHRINVNPREVPLILEYHLKSNKSKLKLFRTLYDYARVIFRELFR